MKEKEKQHLCVRKFPSFACSSLKVPSSRKNEFSEAGVKIMTVVTSIKGREILISQ